MISLAFIGFFGSIYHPAGMGLISKGCKRRGHALSITGVFGTLGLVLAPVVTGIITYGFGWRVLYIALGVPVFLSGLVVFFVTIDETSVQTHASRYAGGKGRSMLYFAVLCVCMMLIGFCFRGTSVVITAYFEEAVPFLNNIIKNLSFITLTGTKTLAATVLTSMVYFFGVFGMIAGGRIADKVDLRLGYFSFNLLTLPFMVLMTQFTGVPLLIFTMGYLFFAMGLQPVENSLVARLTPERLRSTSFGFKFIFTFGVGSLSVVIAKQLIKNYGFVHVFWVQAVLIVLVLLTILLLTFLARHERLRNEQ